MRTFVSAFRKTDSNIREVRYFSWLECRPVTPEVEGSSPFRTAKSPRAILGFFCGVEGTLLQK